MNGDKSNREAFLFYPLEDTIYYVHREEEERCIRAEENYIGIGRDYIYKLNQNILPCNTPTNDKFLV